MNISRGDIFVAALDPIVGREIAKTRPVVIVSNNTNNEYAGTVTVLPITSKNVQKTYPFELRLPKGSGNLSKESKVKADQIRTLDKTRLVKHIGSLDDRTMSDLDRAIGIHLAV